MMIIAAVFLISMTGCGKPDEPDPEPEEVKEAKVELDYAAEDVTDFVVNPAFDSEDPFVYLTLKTDQTIKDFKFLNVYSVKDDQYYIDNVAYEKTELKKDEEVHYSTVFIGLMPNNAFSYTDTDGKEKAFFISASGKDGSIVTGEIKIVDKPADAPEPEQPAKPDVVVEPDVPEPAQEASVTIRYATDADLDSLSNYDQIMDPAFDSDEYRDYLRNVLFYTDSALTDFRILSCDVGNVDETGTGMIVQSVDYNYGTVEAGYSLIIQTTFPGSASVRGIAFTDPTGAEKAFILSESGRDGSLVATPAYIQ